MPRQMNRLVPLTVGRLKDPGMYPDGGGLYLQISKAGNKAWIFRYAVNGKDRQMGLGPLHTISLSEARAKAKECRQKRLDGIDPLDQKQEIRRAAREAKARRMTFAQCAEAYVEAHKSGWKSEKHGSQWLSSLESYAYPIFGDMAVQDIDLACVLKAVEPIWAIKTVTASRLRGRIESILDWATVRSYRTGENPARWRGHLDKVLPACSRVHETEHFAALPYAEMGTFMARLREQDGLAPQALEFVILTCARTSEVTGMPWSEVDMDAAMWVVPASRMKGKREHRVPLSKAAMAILQEQTKAPKSEYVFPGRHPGKRMSNMAMLQTLRRLGVSATSHGFRSTFRDWAAERTSFPTEVAEMALAHAVGDKVEAAYRRGDLFMKRRRIMEKWAEHCAQLSSTSPTVEMIRPRSGRVV